MLERPLLVVACLIVAFVLEGSAAQVAPLVPAERLSSRAACERALSEQRPSLADTESVRVATWNVRWFPDSVAEPDARAKGSDVEWLSCAMALLGAPVIAVQEFRKHERAEAHLEALLEELDARTGGRWRARLDDCPGATTSHVGFLYDSARVRAERFWSIDRLSASAGCASDQHPGFAGYFDFGGLDATLVSVHFMWGFSQQSLEWRRRARAELAGARADIVARTGDEDVLVLGDFNTNGTRGGAPELSVEQELQELAAAAARLHLVPNDQPCTQIQPSGQGFPLDHVLVSASVRESMPRAAAHVGGLCALWRCRPREPANSPYYERLSDHCPVVVELGSKNPSRSSRLPVHFSHEQVGIEQARTSDFRRTSSHDPMR